MPQPTCALWRLTVVKVLSAHKSDLVRGAKVAGTPISLSVTIMVEVRGQDAVLARAGQTTSETTVVEDLVKDGMIKEATVTGATIIRTRSVAPGHHVHVMAGAHVSGLTPEIGMRVMIKGATVRKKSAVTVGSVSGAGTEFRLPEKVSVTGAEADGATMTTIDTGPRKVSRGGGVVAVQKVQGGPAAVIGASPPGQVAKHVIRALVVVVPTTVRLNVGFSNLRKPLKTGSLAGEMRTRGRKAKIILLLQGGAVWYQGQVLRILSEGSRELPRDLQHVANADAPHPDTPKATPVVPGVIFAMAGIWASNPGLTWDSIPRTPLVFSAGLKEWVREAHKFRKIRPPQKELLNPAQLYFESSNTPPVIDESLIDSGSQIPAVAGTEFFCQTRIV